MEEGNLWGRLSHDGQPAWSGLELESATLPSPSVKLAYIEYCDWVKCNCSHDPHTKKWLSVSYKVYCVPRLLGEHMLRADVISNMKIWSRDEINHLTVDRCDSYGQVHAEIYTPSRVWQNYLFDNISLIRQRKAPWWGKRALTSSATGAPRSSTCGK